MLVLVRVAIAFAGAGAAKSDTGRQLRLQRLAVPRLIGPRHDAAGGRADGRAIQIEANAGNQAFDMFFRKAGVRAGGAGFNAEGTGIDTGRDRIRVSRMLGMRAKHGAHD